MKKSFLILTVVLFGASLTGWAQEASIVGTVTDTSGAVIPGARVTVENAGRGFTRNLVTNSAGAYVAAAVPIGQYVVSAEAPGFRKLVRSGVVVRVGARLRVDVRLTVGSVTQVVHVAASPVHVQTETAELSDVINGTQISNLQLNGRDFASLMLLVPGAAPDNSLDLSNPQNSGDVTVSVNGARRRMNNYTVNGMMDVDLGGQGGPEATPSVDSIAEFRVATSNYSARYSLTSGAQVSVVTKSGTTQFHGDAYDYFRNTKLEANPWFVNRTIAPPGGHAPKAPLHWNDFGYTLGGPLYIPGHYNTAKKKTFFFWSNEFHRYRAPQVINALVPTARERAGDFSECDPSSSNYNSVVASGCTLPVSTVDGKAYDTVQAMPEFNPQSFTDATDLLNAFVPLPNSGVDDYTHSGPFNTDWGQEMLRVDQNFSDKTSMFVSYQRESFNVLYATGNGNGDTYDTLNDANPGNNTHASVHLTHIFAPNLVNTTDIGVLYSWDREFDVRGANSVVPSFDRPSNFVMNHLFTANDGNPLLPGVEVDNTGVPFQFVMDTGPLPLERGTQQAAISDDLSWVHGRHSLSFGFYFLKYQKNEPLETGANVNGYLLFGASGTLSTTNAFADMLLGKIDKYTEAEVQGFKTGTPTVVGGYGRGYYRSTDIEPYFGDDWRVSHKLTLNLGLRYSYYVPQHDRQNPPVDNTFIPSEYNPALQAQLDSNDNLIPGSGFNYTEYGNGLVNCDRNGVPQGCQNVNEDNFGPRFGFSYDPTGSAKTVIRGGYGWYHSVTSESGAEGMGGNAPSALSPSGFNLPGYDSIVPGALPPYSAFLFIPLNQKMPSMQQWSLGVQHMFQGNNLLTLTYVGSVGHHLASIYNFNRVPIGVGTENAPGLAGTGTPGCDAAGNCDVQTVLINQYAPPDYFVPYRGFTTMTYNPLRANSNYNAFEAEFRHALGHGLMFQAAYTWSHALDGTSGDGVQSGTGDPNLERWYGNSRFNRAQMLVMNYVYNLPFFAHANKAFVRQALEGWVVSGITTFYAGIPISTFGVCRIDGFSNGVGEGVQCNTVGVLKPDKHIVNDPQFGPTETWFDPNVMTQPTLAQLSANNEPGMFGYMGRNALTGPGRANWDLSLLKNFRLPWLGKERSTLQFRLEAFNAFNTPQWNGINFTCAGSNADGSPAFGSPCGGANNIGNGEVNSTFPPREVELAAKFIF
ncbi:MAG: carboxypeptidase regulatory-like domain-containing protein [Terriglobia bacterium]